MQVPVSSIKDSSKAKDSIHSKKKKKRNELIEQKN